MTDINEILKSYTPCSGDEYDNALVFALKKWISDEINNIPENGVYAVGISLKKDGAAFAYNTEEHLKNGGKKWTLSDWKEQSFGSPDKDENVYGAVDMWLSFKGFSECTDNENAGSGFMKCAVLAVRELKKEGIFTERFNRDIPVLMFCGSEDKAENAVYTAAANDTALLDGDYFDGYGFKI